MIAHESNSPRVPSLARESRQSTSTDCRDSYNDFGCHGPVDSKLSDEVRNYLSDEPRVVMIGRPFAAPYLWIPVHKLCAAAKREATSTA